MLKLAASHDVSAIGDLHDAAQTWLTACAAKGGGCVELEDPENMLTLQLAAALRKSSDALGAELTMKGPDGPLPDTIRFAEDPEAQA